MGWRAALGVLGNALCVACLPFAMKRITLILRCYLLGGKAVLWMVSLLPFYAVQVHL